MTTTSGQTIRYTTNGSIPTAADAEWTGSRELDEEMLSHSDIFRLQISPDEIWSPCDDVDHIVVLRAALFSASGSRCSEVNTEVYVINSMLGRSVSLPIVSLCIDSTDLFDFDSGIFVPGVHFDPQNIYHSGNYCQKGEEWEREANMCYFENGTIALQQDCGVRMHGNRTRSYMQKGFTLYARQEYGDKRFDYPFFEGLKQKHFKRLVLRPWMASWKGGGVEDWLAQQMAKPLLCDNLATRPVTLFLNGEYWGVYFLEEKSDEHYIEEHYDFDRETVDLLGDWGYIVENGDASEWLAFYDWLGSADLNNEADYARVESFVDIDALLDYMLLEFFIANEDWPANNVRQWSADGSPWRWLFFDADAGFHNNITEDMMFDYLTCNDSTQIYPSSPRASLLFRRLLERQDIKEKMLTRLIQLVNSVFDSDNTVRLLNKVTEQVEDEVRHQAHRFGSPNSKSHWDTEIDNIRHFLKSRSNTIVERFAHLLELELPDDGASIWPNPSLGEAILHLNNPYGTSLTVEIYDMMGRCLFRKELVLDSGISEMPMPPLAKGVYFVRTSLDDKSIRWVVR